MPDGGATETRGRLPLWLYDKRVDRLGGRVRRFGSRRPLRVVLTVVDRDKYLADSYLFSVGRLGVQFGPAEGVAAGFTSLPRGSRSRLWEFRDGRGLGMFWEGRDRA